MVSAVEMSTRKRRSEKWEIKTRPDLLTPKLEAVHDLSSQQIRVTYSNIDSLYDRVAEILDDDGVLSSSRISYRAYAEELWKKSSKYSGKTLESEVFSVYAKEICFGLNDATLDKISMLVGVTTSKSLLLSRLGAVPEVPYRGPTPPPSPTEGDLWYHTVENRLYIYVV